ncbi:hypothetical protein F4561_003458 [Lipingzhangella halophila]|uniref:Uncharacterized protein n=1 Tax=Lipingzhangella halophila TaxID=1783352 RepID=A0A7W7W3L3_9ACTN|nr:hypothetical protein [Lipingzhangella halophila]MBB4932638.1 hypothetical protein [Lipingzhangella halophila]
MRVELWTAGSATLRDAAGEQAERLAGFREAPIPGAEFAGRIRVHRVPLERERRFFGARTRTGKVNRIIIREMRLAGE